MKKVKNNNKAAEKAHIYFTHYHATVIATQNRFQTHLLALPLLLPLLQVKIVVWTNPLVTMESICCHCRTVWTDLYGLSLIHKHRNDNNHLYFKDY